MRKLGLVLALAATITHADKACRFALDYSSADILSNKTAQSEFISKVLEKEAVFMREIGYNNATGLTQSVIKLNKRTGMPISDSSDRSSSRSEAVHIGVLTSSLAESNAFYSQEEALAILKLKIQSLEEFTKNHPSNE